MFAGYEFASRMIKKYYPTIPSDSTALIYIAGTCGGLWQISILVPMDLLKCRLQIDGQSKARIYRSTFDCFRQVLRKEGVRGLYGGLGATMGYLPSFGLYFLLYNRVEKSLLQYFDCVKESPTGLLSMVVAGGVAGMGSWASIYPFDVMKV